MEIKIYVAPKVLRVINDALCGGETITETANGSVYHGSAKETTFDFDEEEEEDVNPWT